VKTVHQDIINEHAGIPNQGVYAEISPITTFSMEEILNQIQTGLILILNHIQDTGNLGALIRTAVAANVDAIIMDQHQSAPINETVIKASAGTAVKAKMVKSKNLSRDIEKLKKSGFWIVGTSSHSDTPYYKYDFSYKTAIIVGNEHKGISPLLKKKSDHMIFIPQANDVESLNVSAATAVILFEALRQKSQSTFPSP
jgi:23S rRNA (guanosine2251-2'-O)-methyltransferase